MLAVPYRDVYAGADFVPLLKRRPIISFTDYDGTRTESHCGPVSPQAAADCASAHKFEEEQEIATGAITARSLPMTMTKAQYDASVARGLDQPPPKWFKNNKGLYVPGDWCKDPFFNGCTGAHVAGSLGGGIGVRVDNGKAYLVDAKYEDLLKYDHLTDAERAADTMTYEEVVASMVPRVHGLGQSQAHVESQLGPTLWKTAILEFLTVHRASALRFRPDIEFGELYEKGEANSPPQIGRLQLSGKGREAFEEFCALDALIAEQCHKDNRLALRINPTSEDKVDLNNPENTSYTKYLLPWHGVKQKMFNWLIKHMAAAAGLSMRDLLVLYAGDTITDLLTSLWGGGSARVVALIARNSRLTQAILERWQYYGMHYMGDLWANPAKGRYEDRLQPTNHKGIYRVFHKIRGGRCNYVVLGDVRYGDQTTTAPGSVDLFLREFVPKTPYVGTADQVWWDSNLRASA